MSKKKVTFGSWLTQPYYAIVETMAKSNFFDWLTIDIEHSTISMNQMENMLRLIQLSGLEGYIRLSENDSVSIKKALDAGADGVIIPMVNTLQDVEKAVKSSFYPPLGERGCGLSRAHDYNRSGFKSYLKNKESQIKIMVIIENIKAVDNINEIFSSPNLYGYFIGPYDLSASIGKPGDYNDKELISAIAKIKNAAYKQNILKGYHVVEPDFAEVSAKINEGYQLIAISTDMLFFIKGMTETLKQ